MGGVIGGVVGGPIGALAGFKIGALGAVAGERKRLGGALPTPSLHLRRHSWSSRWRLAGIQETKECRELYPTTKSENRLSQVTHHFI